MPETSTAAIMLAAGLGKRMKSSLPKGLHEVCGLPMVEHIVRSLKGAGVDRIVTVIGSGGDLVQRVLEGSSEFAWQTEQKGTGHATQMAAPLLESHSGPIIIIPGDTPLIDAEAIKELMAAHNKAGAACTVATAKLPDPTGYGRVIRGMGGTVTSIVEHVDASEIQREVNEINAGLYCVDAKALFEALPALKSDTAQGEYYLTDIIKLLSHKGLKVIAHCFRDPEIFMGVNDRWQLSEAEDVMRKRILKSHALNGVTIRDRNSIFIGPDVVIEQDAVIEASTSLSGSTRIGSGSRIGPFTIVDDSEVGQNTTIFFSRLSSAKVGSDVKIGPFANIRPLSDIGDKVKIGNFVEVKKSTMGEGAAASHLSYIGDATVGAKANIGAGTITCNYDGFKKSRTEIGEGVFVGSNSTLVAPVTIGEGAFIAAGSVITSDVPPDALGLGRARQEVKEEWASRWRNKNQVNR